jgi:hypothetical protein
MFSQALHSKLTALSKAENPVPSVDVYLFAAFTKESGFINAVNAVKKKGTRSLFSLQFESMYVFLLCLSIYLGVELYCCPVL